MRWAGCFILVVGSMPEKQAYALTSSVMAFLGAFLTGLGVYDKLGIFAGMGAALPITGFANSVVSPVMAQAGRVCAGWSQDVSWQGL